MPQAQSDTQFWTIERAVAFVVAPIATAASGWLSAVIATNLPGHPHVSSGGIYAFMATVAAGTAASFIKWLDGRQKFTNLVIPIEQARRNTLGPQSAQSQATPTTRPVDMAAASQEPALMEGAPDAAPTDTPAASPGAFMQGAPSAPPTDTPTALPEPAFLEGATESIEPVEASGGNWVAPNDPAPPTPPGGSFA